MSNSIHNRVSPVVHARITGLAGVVMLTSGSITAFIGSKLIASEDVVATSQRLVASESLLRFGIVSSLVMMLAFLFYGLLLYSLLRPVHTGYARFMLAFVLVSAPIYMLNQVNLFAALLSASHEQHEQVK